jgi:hypothetical protein
MRQFAVFAAQFADYVVNVNSQFTIMPLFILTKSRLPKAYVS